MLISDLTPTQFFNIAEIRIILVPNPTKQLSISDSNSSRQFIS